MSPLSRTLPSLAEPAYNAEVKSVPSLAASMTPFPYSVAADAPVTEATKMMDEHDFHHLPVTDGGQLVGVVSQRDILFAEALGKEGLKVRDLQSRDPYVVDLKTTLLLEVVSTMAERNLDAALVTRQDKLVGILTTTDLARILAEVLRATVPPEPSSPEIA